MRKNRGFTLIELLIVVAIIGIIAAIAIPNLLNAINRGRQKRSMSDMRTTGTAIEAYAVDMAFYPAQTDGFYSAAFVGYLEPTYVKSVPQKDGWRYGFRAASESRFYTLVSCGRDTVSQGGADSYTAGTVTSDMDCDIVFGNGTFLQYPEGVQTD